MAGRKSTWPLVALAAILLSVFLLTFGTGCKSDKGNPYGGGGGGGGNPGTNEVWIQGSAFDPGTRSITHGTTITWTNKDGIAHTVTSGTPGNPNGTFDSGNIAPGASYSYRFDTPGNYPYYCNIHHSMTGTISVQ